MVVINLFECIWCRVAFGRRGRSTSFRMPCESCEEETRDWGKPEWRNFQRSLDADDRQRALDEMGDS
jgi:hypothetical protein